MASTCVKKLWPALALRSYGPAAIPASGIFSLHSSSVSILASLAVSRLHAGCAQCGLSTCKPDLKPLVPGLQLSQLYAHRMDEFLAGARPLLQASSRLPPRTLEVTRVADANRAQPSAAALSSVAFHPSGQLLLTAGLDRRLHFFQVQRQQQLCEPVLTACTCASEGGAQLVAHTALVLRVLREAC